MKILLSIFFTALSCIYLFAQAPQKMSYQALIRNNSNNPVVNSPIGMRTTILQGSSSGTVVYQEIYNPNPQTNANGLVSIEIGAGIAITGTFSGINWATGPYYIKTETDPTGGTAYSIAGTQQLMSVPYALYAASSGNSTSLMAPTVTTQAATSVTKTTATLNGLGNGNGFKSDVSFELGTTTAYGRTVPASTIVGSSSAPLSVNATNLEANTLYHFRANASNAVNSTNGSDLTFTTSMASPTVSCNGIDTAGLGQNKVRLKGVVNADGSNSTITMEWGTTTSYGNSAACTPSSATGTSNTDILSSFITVSKNQTYHFRVMAVSSSGTFYSSDCSFATALAPSVSCNGGDSIANNTAQFRGLVNANGANATVTMEWGTTTSYGNVVACTPSTVTGTSNTIIKSSNIVLPQSGPGLYHFRVKAVSSAGTTYSSDCVYYH